jgi:hypothetical protein
MTHDDLWTGIDLKIQAARTTFEEMRKVFRPPTATAWAIIQESTGTIVGGPDWQRSFYQLVARFLAEVRSVPWIIAGELLSQGSSSSAPDFRENIALSRELEKFLVGRIMLRHSFEFSCSLDRSLAQRAGRARHSEGEPNKTDD